MSRGGYATRVRARRALALLPRRCLSAELRAALEQNPRRVALARRTMLVVSRTVLGGCRQRVELVEEREDLARADEQGAVGLEHRDLVGAGAGDERNPLLGPRRDLARDEV